MSDTNGLSLSQDEVQLCHVPLLLPPSTRPSTALTNPRRTSIAGNARSRSRRVDFLPLGVSQGERELRRFNSSPSTLRRLGKDIAPRASGNESRERKKREDRHTGRSRHHDGPQTLRRAASRRLSRLGRLSGRPALRKPRHRRAPAARSPWPGRPRTPFRSCPSFNIRIHSRDA